MDKEHKLLLGSVIVGIVLNLVLPMVVRPFATKEQISPPNGAGNLSFFDQIMHMLVHHGQVPLTSSIIIAVIIVISNMLGKYVSKFL